MALLFQYEASTCMHAKLPFFLDPWDFPVCALFAFQRHQFRFNPLLAVNKMPTGFRSNIFDPFLIIAKIVSLFCFHCACLGGWLVLANFIGGTHSTIDQLFDYQVSDIIILVYILVSASYHVTSAH